MFKLQPFLEDLYHMASWSTERQLAVALSVAIALHLIADIGISIDSRVDLFFGALAALLAWTVGHFAARSIGNIWTGIKLVGTPRTGRGGH